MTGVVSRALLVRNVCVKLNYAFPTLADRIGELLLEGEVPVLCLRHEPVCSGINYFGIHRLIKLVGDNNGPLFHQSADRLCSPVTFHF